MDVKTLYTLTAIADRGSMAKAGDAIGYNATHKCNAPTRVATIAMGYADGYWRGFSSKGRVRTG